MDRIDLLICFIHEDVHKDQHDDFGIGFCLNDKEDKNEMFLSETDVDIFSFNKYFHAAVKDAFLKMKKETMYNKPQIIISKGGPYKMRLEYYDPITSDIDPDISIMINVPLQTLKDMLNKIPERINIYDVMNNRL